MNLNVKAVLQVLAARLERIKSVLLFVKGRTDFIRYFVPFRIAFYTLQVLAALNSPVIIVKIKIGLIGLGKVAHLHARALQSVARADFIAVCGRDAQRTQQFAAEYGVRNFTDLSAMLAEIDCLIVCAPHPAHAAITVAAARAGVHVLVEKPLAASLKDCDLMIAAAREHQVKLGTISQRRFYAPCQRIKAAIDDGEIGRAVLGSVAMYGWRDAAYYESDAWRGTWRGEGGGVLVNQAPHQLDLLLWFLGPVAQLAGYHTNFNHPTIEVEDTAVAIVRFQSGALGQIVVSNAQNPALWGKVAVHGSKGASLGVQTDGGAMFIAGVSKIEEAPVNDMWTIPGVDLASLQREDEAFFASIDATTYYHALQIADFVAAIEENRAPLVTGEDGRRTVELFTALYRSQRDHAPLDFPLRAESGRDDFDGRL